MPKNSRSSPARSRSRKKSKDDFGRRDRSRSRDRGRGRSVSRYKNNKHQGKRRSPSANWERGLNKQSRGRRSRSKKGGTTRSPSTKKQSRSASRKNDKKSNAAVDRAAKVMKSPERYPTRGSPARPSEPSRARSEEANDRDWRTEGEAHQGACATDAAWGDAEEDLGTSVPKPAEMEAHVVTLGERPFGMAPSKEADVKGYVVSKVAEGRPADGQGVQIGWRVLAVGEKECGFMASEAVQQLLKDTELPVKVTFERPKPPANDNDDSENAEDDVLDERAEFRLANSGAMGNLDDLPVTRDPEGLPEPITSWQDAINRGFLNKPLMDKLHAAGLKRPTLIQCHALPIVQPGHYDLIALAQTGSGKTFGFVIPTVARIVIEGAMPRPFFAGKSPGSPLMLCLSPTRELAMQTMKEIEVMTKGTGLQQVVVYGGESLPAQQRRIANSQIDILCATPGRLIDLIDSGKISLSFVQSVILDEADQMLEQSLEVMCAEILTGRDMPEPSQGRQTLLFSATMPQKIRELCPKILRQKQVANITIGHYDEDQGGSCASIRQILKWEPDEARRMHILAQDLRYYWKTGRVVIFTNQRIQAGALAQTLLSHGFKVVHLHGKLDQAVREEVFNNFRNGHSDTLVATNVASRGLDFPDISFVVQFNMPASVDIYTHRIGRTGRIGQVGAAFAYMGPKDRMLAPKLIKFLEMNKQEVPEFLLRLSTSSPPRDFKGKGKYKGKF